MLLSDKEYSILGKYRKSKPIEKGDESMLEKLASINLINFGLNFDNSNYMGTAYLTIQGSYWLNRENTLRNPIKRTLSNIFNCL
nr:hypothetical protein [Candidatus Woesearchaeota archaeon]